MALLTWGLVPPWSKEQGIGDTLHIYFIVNALCENPLPESFSRSPTTAPDTQEDIPSGDLDTTQAGDGLISSYSAYDDSQLLAQRDDNGSTTAYIYDKSKRASSG